MMVCPMICHYFYYMVLKYLLQYSSSAFIHSQHFLDNSLSTKDLAKLLYSFIKISAFFQIASLQTIIFF